jgi:hypothetical protein
MLAVRETGVGEASRRQARELGQRQRRQLLASSTRKSRQRARRQLFGAELEQEIVLMRHS